MPGDVVDVAGEGRAEDGGDADRVLVDVRLDVLGPDHVLVLAQADDPRFDVEVAAELLPDHVDVAAEDEVRLVDRQARRLAALLPLPLQRERAEHDRLRGALGAAAGRLAGRVEEVGEHPDAALLDLGRDRVLGVVDEVAVQVLGDDPLRLRLHPGGDEGGEVAPRDHPRGRVPRRPAASRRARPCRSAGNVLVGRVFGEEAVAVEHRGFARGSGGSFISSCAPSSGVAAEPNAPPAFDRTHLSPHTGDKCVRRLGWTRAGPAHPHRRPHGADRVRRLAPADRPDLRPRRRQVPLRLGHRLDETRPGPRSPPRSSARSTRSCSATTTTTTTSTPPGGRCCRGAGTVRHHRGRARGGSAATPAASPPWASTELSAEGKPPIEVTATPCRHGPPLSQPIVGDVVGFALGWEGQEHGVLWISGDTVLYDGVREVAERLDVGTALIHLGGVRFPVTGPLRYTMTARRGVELCGAVRAADGDPDPLRGLDALPPGPRGDRGRAGRGAGRVPRQRPLAADRRRCHRSSSDAQLAPRSC